MVTFEISNQYTKMQGATSSEHNIALDICTFHWPYFIFNPISRRPERKTQKLCYLKGNKFPSGLLPQIANKLCCSGSQIDFEDLREKPIAKPVKHKFPAELRYYQKEAVKTCLSMGRGIIELPTRSGKTWVAQDIILSLGLNALIIVGNKDLLYQFYNDLCKISKRKKQVGFIGDGEATYAKYTVATIQTLNSRQDDPKMKQFLISRDVLAIDEGHHVKNSNQKLMNTWFDIAMKIPAYYRFGFTGTAGNIGDINRDLLESATGSMIYQKPIKTLIDEGYIAQPEVTMHAVTHHETYREWRTAETAGIVNNRERNSLIARLAIKDSETGTVFISCNKKNHLILLQAKIPNSVTLNGSDTTERRAEVLSQFANGGIKVLISTLLKEGVDIPSMRFMHRAAAGKTDIGTKQTGNRVLTATKDKSKGTIRDYFDYDGGLLTKHSKIRRKIYEGQGFPVEMIT